MFKNLFLPLIAATALAGCSAQFAPAPLTATHPASPEGAQSAPPKRSATLNVIEPVTLAAPPAMKMDHSAHGAMKGMDHSAMPGQSMPGMNHAGHGAPAATEAGKGPQAPAPAKTDKPAETIEGHHGHH